MDRDRENVTNKERYPFSRDIIEDIDSTRIEDGKLGRRRRWFQTVTPKQHKLEK